MICYNTYEGGISMEITIKNNKLNYEILKKNGKYFFPSSFVLIFKLVSLYYIVLILISIFRNRFKLWTIFIVSLAIIIVKILINYFARKLIDVQKELFNKEETSFDLVFLDNGIDVVEETQHHLTEYKSIKEVIDSGTLIVIQVKEDAPIYFEKKNATKDQYEEIRNIFEKNNILCNMKEL